MSSIWPTFRRSSARAISLVRSLDQHDTGPRISDRGKGRFTRSISIRIAVGQCTNLRFGRNRIGRVERGGQAQTFVSDDNAISGSNPVTCAVEWALERFE